MSVSKTDVCATTHTVPLPLTITGSIITPCAPAIGDDQTAALADLNSQATASCTSILTTAGAPTNNLDEGDIDGVGGVAAGTYTAGCYSTVGAMNVTTGTTVTLTGAGTFIFKSGGALTTQANSFVVLAGGASAENVFWIPVGATTIGAYTTGGIPPVTPTFVGNIFRGVADGLSITLGHFAYLLGRTLAFGSTVTTDANTISAVTPATLHVIKVVSSGAVSSDFTIHVKRNTGVEVSGSPLAGVASPGTSYSLSAGTYIVSEDTNSSYTQTFSGDCNSGGSITLSASDNKTCTITNTLRGGSGPTGTITVVKTVVNDNGGTKTVADFPLSVNGTLVFSATTYNYPASGVYTVTETTDPNYTRTFSGDCNINGSINLNTNDNKFCIVTNDDIGAPAVPPVPPLIEVVKIPNPLALPGGPGLVEYTYTLRNIGTVPVTNITMVGDTCAPIVLISGDTNGDSKLDVNETWVHTCSTTLAETHTNTVVATGWANGISAVDIASATVIVGAPIVPPLIHITKVPNPLALLAVGGMITYTKKVTNPGTVALSNVHVNDDKCSPVNYISGDTNGDSKLDVNETWTYTCQMNLTKTTINTATASGEANGLTARDFAIATVVVAAPKLPNTGIAPNEKSSLWNIIVLTGILMLTSISLVIVLRKHTI